MWNTGPETCKSRHTGFGTGNTELGYGMRDTGSRFCTLDTEPRTREQGRTISGLTELGRNGGGPAIEVKPLALYSVARLIRHHWERHVEIRAPAVVWAVVPCQHPGPDLSVPSESLNGPADGYGGPSIVPRVPSCRAKSITWPSPLILLCGVCTGSFSDRALSALWWSLW